VHVLYKRVHTCIYECIGLIGAYNSLYGHAWGGVNKNTVVLAIRSGILIAIIYEILG
jgi:hypothetical protein